MEDGAENLKTEQGKASDTDVCDEADSEVAAEDVADGREKCSESEAEKTDEVSETEEMAEEESAE